VAETTAKRGQDPMPKPKQGALLFFFFFFLCCCCRWRAASSLIADRCC
jgi:hypothetical protein